jgi:phosphoenolpyruvate carboxykinase (GTP)
MPYSRIIKGDAYRHAGSSLAKDQDVVARKLTKHPGLLAWVRDAVDLCQPDVVHWCDGSELEYQFVANQLVETGTFIPLNDEKRPNSFYARSEMGDVARVEDRTFICSEKAEDAGPTNHWESPKKMKSRLERLFEGCMRGRTMYVIPYVMGPVGSEIAKIGVQVTDSGYAVCNMHMMAHVGVPALKMLGRRGEFCKGLHSVGVPLLDGQPDTPWPCNEKEKYIVHFPETREIMSFGSGYGGNALLGKKCFALRIGSVIARDEGWLAEHMLIMKLTNPEGKFKYIAAAFPSACGKTNMAMLTPALKGWKVETVGDDIAWMKFVKGKDGVTRLRAINPEAGFFGVAPGTSDESNANAMKTITHDAIFTNVALTDQGDVWWEGMSKEKPGYLVDWTRRVWTPDCGRKSSHPNARFTVRAGQCPVIAKEWQDPEGVPISAILFGGRRAGVAPLVVQANSWQHGVFLGSIMASEKTAAASGKVGVLRRDPMAMLPFCGYHMGDYFAHWLKVGEDNAGTGLPEIFHVNWFRQDAKGTYLWPGFGENARVLKWVFDRLEGKGTGVQTAVGVLPGTGPGGLDVTGLKISKGALKEILSVDAEGWADEVPLIKEHYRQFGTRLPKGLREELAKLEGAF